MIKYKTILIMIYLNEYQDEYLLSEICELCDFTTKQLHRELDFMVIEELISTDKGIYSLTDKSIEILSEKGVLSTSIEELQSDTLTLKFTNSKLNFEDIFIPIDFKL